jgi:hypothetical protein
MFRFTIRDLLWLTLVVAVATAWLAREQHFRPVVDQAIIDEVSKEHRKWMGQIGALLYYIEKETGCPVACSKGGYRLTVYTPKGQIGYDVLDFDESSLYQSK